MKRAVLRQHQLRAWQQGLPVLDAMLAGDWNKVSARLEQPDFDATVFLQFLYDNDCASTFYALSVGAGESARLPSKMLMELMASWNWWARRRLDLLDALDEVIATSRNASLDPLLIKGFHYAERFYGAVETRWTRDLDLLVPVHKLAEFSDVLQQLGYRADHPDWVPRSTSQRLNHAVNWERGVVHVDLHHGLRVRPGYRIDNHRLFRDSVQFEVGGIHCNGLSDEHQMLLILLSLASDIEQGRVSAKQVLDFCQATSVLDETLDWSAWLEQREKEGTVQVLCAAARLVLQAMPRSARCPRFDEALEMHDSGRKNASLMTSDEAFALLAAPPHSFANRRWLMSHYSGSLTGYLAWWLLGGFLRPGSVGALISHLRGRS